MPSEVIKTFEHNADTSVLRITFTSGDVYDYEDVPREVYHEFRSAFSKGQFFARHIRPKYRYQRVNRDPDFWRPGVGQ